MPPGVTVQNLRHGGTWRVAPGRDPDGL